MESIQNKSLVNIRRKQLYNKLAEIINNPNASSNWKSMVLSWNGLTGLSQGGKPLNSTKVKNDIIKNIETKRLKHFASLKKLPPNWKNRISRWPNVNKKNKNEAMNAVFKAKVKATQKVYRNYHKKRTHVKSLRHKILKNLFVQQNVKNYTDPKTGMKYKYVELPNGRKVNLSNMNMFELKNLEGKGILRGIDYETKKKLNYSVRKLGMNVYTYVTAYKNRPHVKNFVNTVAMMNRVYHPSNMRYKRIVSDIFSSTYKLLKVSKKHFNNKKEGSVSFITRHIRVPANRARSRYYEPLPFKTIGNDTFQRPSDFYAFLRQYKKLFMTTKVLHAPLWKRKQIWNTIKNWKGTLAMCIATCNMIYYSSNRNHKGSYNFNI